MNSIKLFQSAKIRSVWNEEEQQWYFSVVDIVGALTDSVNPTAYLKKYAKEIPSFGLT
ncbi:phage antirepressor protein [Phascolarctobacterium succinatutens]|uniref:phage antirepressor protein n=1 Tax=Phascolarctobacterium succinatutens TaxID=626940 RepID=UPI003AB191D6